MRFLKTVLAALFVTAVAAQGGEAPAQGAIVTNEGGSPTTVTTNAGAAPATITTTMTTTTTTGMLAGDQLSSLLMSMGINLPLPQSVYDALNKIPMEALPFGQIDINAIPPNILIGGATLFYSAYEPECQKALLQYNNITSTCLGAFNDAKGRLQDNANDIRADANGQIQLNETSVEWGKICRENGPVCLGQMRSNLEQIKLVCPSDILNEINLDVAEKYWNDVLCTQNADGHFCYPAFQAALQWANGGDKPSIDGQKLTMWCNDCTYKVINGYASIPQSYDLTGVLPTICADIGGELCYPQLQGLTASKDQNELIQRGSNLLCSPCGLKVLNNLRQVPAIAEQLDKYQSYLPCLNPGFGNTTAELPSQLSCLSQVDAALPESARGQSFLGSPVLGALQPCISDYTSRKCGDACKAILNPLAAQAACCITPVFDQVRGSLPAAYANFIPSREQLTSFVTETCAIPIDVASCADVSSTTVSTTTTTPASTTVSAATSAPAMTEQPATVEATGSASTSSSTETTTTTTSASSSMDASNANGASNASGAGTSTTVESDGGMQRVFNGAGHLQAQWFQTLSLAAVAMSLVALLL